MLAGGGRLRHALDGAQRNNAGQPLGSTRRAARIPAPSPGAFDSTRPGGTLAKSHAQRTASRLPSVFALTRAPLCARTPQGMLAMLGPYVVYYDPGIVLGSSLLALVVSGAGLFIVVQCAYVGASWFSLVIRVAAALVIAFAVNSVHYSGMYAASYHYTGDESDNFNVHLGHNMHFEALQVVMVAFNVSTVQLIGTHAHLNDMARKALARARYDASADNGSVDPRLQESDLEDAWG
jgi:hypothetical protein